MVEAIHTTRLARSAGALAPSCHFPAGLFRAGSHGRDSSPCRPRTTQGRLVGCACSAAGDHPSTIAQDSAFADDDQAMVEKGWFDTHRPASASEGLLSTAGLDARPRAARDGLARPLSRRWRKALCLS